jgi:hypothetical protein
MGDTGIKAIRKVQYVKCKEGEIAHRTMESLKEQEMI